MLDEANMPYSACVRCATCDGFPCLVHAKSDAEVLGVRPALEHANVTLLTNARAVRLETERRRHARSPGGRRARRRRARRSPRDIVVVSCGAANTAKLLLASASDAHPNGLANGSDQVGRNYMFHNSQAVLALSKEPNPTSSRRRSGSTTSTSATDDFDYPMGNIQMVGKSQAEMYRGEKPLRDEARARVDAATSVAHHAVDFWLSTEDLPRPENRVTLRERRQHRARLHADQRGRPRSACYHELKSMLGTSGCTTTTSSRATPT